MSYRSIREIRSLSGIRREEKTRPRPIRVPSFIDKKGDPAPLTSSEVDALDAKFANRNLARFPVPDTSHHAEQANIVRRIFESIEIDGSKIKMLKSKDSQGNTALHYLCGNRLPNSSLIG